MATAVMMRKIPCGNLPFAGAWGVHATGSPAKVGEYQSLDSSPFWNADVIASDGQRTLDFVATGSDDEDQQGNLHFYGGPRADRGHRL